MIIKTFLILKIISTKIQIKFFILTFLNFVIAVVRFWWGLKKGHEPQKVIYYEHAQHQHHYDHNDAWGAGSEPQSYWVRRDGNGEEDEYAQDLAYAKQRPYGVSYEKVDDKQGNSWWG